MAAIKQADDTSDSNGDSETAVVTSFAVAPEEDMAKLNRASKIAKTMTVCMTIAFLILWPMPMYGTSYVFSKPFFTGWVVVGILWLFCSSIAVGLFPLWEGRQSLVRVFKGMFGMGGSDITEEIQGKAVHEEKIDEFEKQ
jgi:hypothetical protein